MFAVVEITGVQFEVHPNEKIRVPLLEGNPGDKVTFDKVLIAGSDDKTSTGTPYIGGTVEGTILEHGRDKKVLVFKKKRRKGYRKLNGHKQDFTSIEITKMEIDGFDSFVSKTTPVIAKPETDKEQIENEEV